MSRRWAELAAAPERVGLFIAERSLPPFGHRELATHRSEARTAALTDGHQLRRGPAVPLDHHGFAVHDEVEEFRELRLGAMQADVQLAQFSPFIGLNTLRCLILPDWGNGARPRRVACAVRPT